MNELNELRIADRVKELAIGWTRRQAQLFQIFASDERRGIELVGWQCQLGPAKVDFGRRFVHDAGHGFTVSQQFVDARLDEHALKLRPWLPAGCANERLVVQELFDAAELVRR